MHDAPAIAPPAQQPGDEPAAGPPRSRREIVLDWLSAGPLVPPAIGLAGGIFLDAALLVPLWVAAAAFVAAGGLLLQSPRNDLRRHVAVALAALAMGTVLHDLNFRRWPADHVVQYCAAEPTPAQLTGVIVQTPLIVPPRAGRIAWFPQQPRTRLLIDADQIQGVAGPIGVSGLVAVVVREPVPGVRAGDRVRLFGTLHRPAPPANPGERDWALVNRRNGVLVEMSCEHAANVTVLAQGNGPARWLGIVRRRACAAMHEQAFEDGEPGARLLDALVLGQRSAVDADLNQAFINTGTVHYLSVSGAHIGVLLAFVWLVGWLLGRSRRQCALWAAVLVVAYAILTEPSPAITRSAIMAVVCCVAILARRPLRSANTLAAAAIILLVIHPTQLFDPGFQLSFFTLLAVMFLAPRVHAVAKRAMDKLLKRDDPLLQPAIQNMLNPPSRRRIVLDFCLHKLGWALAISTAASAVGACLSSYHFRQVPPWGWFNTVLVTIPMSAVLLLGLVKTVVSVLFPPAAVVLGWPLEKLTDLLISVIRLLDRLPGSGASSPEVPAWLAAAALGVLALWMLAPPLLIRWQWVVGTMAGLALLTTWNLLPHRRADTLQLDVLSVGDGLACVIQLPGDLTVVNDLGTLRPYDLQRWTIGPFMAHQRIRSVDRLLISHPHPDHLCGVFDVLDRMTVREVITTPHYVKLAKRGSPARQLIRELRTRAGPWRTAVRGEGLANMGPVKFEVLWPPRMEDLDIRDENDSSLVVRITYAGRRILFCGDIGEIPQERLIRSRDLAADVLILPHHGGVVPTTEALIRAVNPAYCIRSSGQPDRETTSGLLEAVAGRHYFNTADHGAIEVRIAPGGFTVHPFR